MTGACATRRAGCRHSPVFRARADRSPAPRHLVGVSLRDDRGDADDAARRGGDREEDGDGVRPRLPVLQPQVPVGPDRRPRPPAGARRCDRAAARVARRHRRRGDGERVLARADRSAREPRHDRRGDARGGADRRDVRHRHRRLPHRDADPRSARRRLGHVAIRLAARRGGGRRSLALDRRRAARGGASGVYRRRRCSRLPGDRGGLESCSASRSTAPSRPARGWSGRRRRCRRAAGRLLPPRRGRGSSCCSCWSTSLAIRWRTCRSGCCSTTSASPRTEVAFYDVGLGARRPISSASSSAASSTPASGCAARCSSASS